jgi:aminoglycoside phosphotransferase
MLRFLDLWLRVPTIIRLRVYRVLVYIGLHLYGPTSSPQCFRLPFNLYAKEGLNVPISEAHAMLYIAKHTTIPIPRVIDAIETPLGAMIIMTRLNGEPLRDGLRRMTQSELSLLAQDMKLCFDQLRSLSDPTIGRGVRGLGAEKFRCYRISFDPIGPFKSEQEFHHFLLFERVPLKDRDRLIQLAQKVHSKAYRLCLTHNDLTPLNILINENKRLSGIVDWECAAWLPEYWEYTRSHWHRDGYLEWHSFMDAVFDTWPEELAVEEEIWKYSDPF